jgi:PAP2 superfamily
MARSRTNGFQMLYWRRRARLVVCVCLWWVSSATACQGGFDHRLAYDNSGIWNRNVQQALNYTLIAGEIIGGLWEGGQTRLGRTFWQSIDASAIGAVSVEILKPIFSRVRPADTADPCEWFKGDNHRSFPSGEVTNVAAIVTPFILEYRHDYPAVYLLEVLPVYDAIARMKVQAHWQTDVLAGFAIGTGLAFYAHSRTTPIILGVLPHGFSVGLRYRF